MFSLNSSTPSPSASVDIPEEGDIVYGTFADAGASLGNSEVLNSVSDEGFSQTPPVTLHEKGRPSPPRLPHEFFVYSTPPEDLERTDSGHVLHKVTIKSHQIPRGPVKPFEYTVKDEARGRIPKAFLNSRAELYGSYMKSRRHTPTRRHYRAIRRVNPLTIPAAPPRRRIDPGPVEEQDGGKPVSPVHVSVVNKSGWKKITHVVHRAFDMVKAFFARLVSSFENLVSLKKRKKLGPLFFSSSSFRDFSSNPIRV